MENTYLQNYNSAMEGLAEQITKEAITQAINKTTELISQYTNELEKIKTNYKILDKKQEETVNKLDNTIQEYKRLKEVTYVLATDDGKMKELTKLMQSLTYKKFTGTKNSLKDKLFHMSITDSCYRHLYGQYQVNSYKRISIDDFDESMKVIKKWFGNEQNIKRTVNKKLQEYIKDEYLSSEKQKMVDKYLEITNGGNNIAI